MSCYCLMLSYELKYLVLLFFFFPMKDLSKVFLVNVSVGQVLPLGIWLLIQDCIKSHMAHSVLH